MQQTRYNERSWAIDLISDINLWLQGKELVIKRAGGERTVKLANGSLFPDVLLFGDAESGTILQGWELKMPDTDIDDAELLENAEKKARILGLNSFVVWNVTYAVLYIKKDDQFEKLQTWSGLAHIQRRDEVVHSLNVIREYSATILSDLNQFLDEGVIKPGTIIDSITNDRLSDLILGNIPIYAASMKHLANTNYQFEDQVTNWWLVAKNEYGDEDRWKVLARSNLISLFNKFVFAHTLRHFNHKANLIDTITEGTNADQGLEVFKSISASADFWNIFSDNLGDDAIPDSTWNNFVDLNALLAEFNVNKIEPELIHELLDKLALKTKRKAAGQFATPMPLAQIITRLVMLDPSSNAIDPCCGTGTIAKAIYNYKKERGVVEPLDTTWASDKFALPLRMATLAIVDPENIGKQLRLFRHDAMELETGKEVVLHSPDDGSEVHYTLPEFDTIISNLPFVQQETLNRLNFGAANINEFIAKTTKDPSITLAPRGDLYTYLPFYLWKILSENGRLGLIISNSWLSSGFGNSFLAALRRFYDIETIITSGSGRWFKNAKVVTNIVVLRKRQNPALDTPQKIKFVTLKKSIEDISGQNLMLDLRAKINTTESANDDLIAIHTYDETLHGHSSAAELPLSARFTDLEWLEQARESLVPLSLHFAVNRGERRGWDKMFYPDQPHHIEAEYLKPVLLSPRSLSDVTAHNDGMAFSCDRSIAELHDLGHTGALDWIKKFENQVNQKGEPLMRVLSRSGTNWYTMKSDNLADFVTAINPGERLFFGKFDTPSFVNQRLLTLTSLDETVNPDVTHALLNTTLSMFFVEALGFGRGEGVLDLNATKIKETMRILNPRLLSDSQASDIIRAFQPLKARPVKSIDEEMAMSDRCHFDKIVLATYGLEAIYNPIVESLRELYAIRKSVNN